MGGKLCSVKRKRRLVRVAQTALTWKQGKKQNLLSHLVLVQEMLNLLRKQKVPNLAKGLLKEVNSSQTKRLSKESLFCFYS